MLPWDYVYVTSLGQREADVANLIPVAQPYLQLLPDLPDQPLLDLEPMIGSASRNILHLVAMAMVAIYWHCVIELFSQGRWRKRHLRWVSLAGLLSILAGTSVIRSPRGDFLVVLPVVLDLCMVSCLVVDFWTRGLMH